MKGMAVAGRWLWQVGEVALPLLATVVLVALGLRLLGALPSVWLGPPVTVFASVEEAERAVGARIWLPVYFPEYLDFPPEAIRVEREPVARVWLSFRGRGEAEGARLTITQVLTTQDTLPPEVLAPAATLGRPVDIAGYIGFVGEEAEGYRIYWRAADRHVLVTATLPLQEMLGIVRSLR